MARFVILEHDHPQLHWDFMLEMGSALKTWRLAKEPGNSGEIIEAVPLGDHRVFYLDYEGPVSGDRGQVRRWDYGEYESLPSLGEEKVKVRLVGQKLRGIAVLKEINSRWYFHMQS